MRSLTPPQKKDFADKAPLMDFKAKVGEVLFHYPAKDQRVLLLGLGKKSEASDESMRRAYASAAKALLQKKIDQVQIVMPGVHERGVAEGILLANYAFDEWKSEKSSFLKELTIDHGDLEVFQKAIKIFEGVYAARDLINNNADITTPEYLGHFAKKLEGGKVKVQVRGKEWLKKNGLHLLLAVGKGSSVDPKLITLEYRGAPKSRDHTVVVGKGVTFDTGGLNLKPTGSMEDMKADMSGAAAGLGLIKALKALETVCGGLLSAAIISYFQTFEKNLLAFIIFFIPLITGISGNVGIQCSTVLVRGMAIGTLSVGNRRQAVIKELGIGLITGFVFGIISGMAVFFLNHLGMQHFEIEPLRIGVLVGTGVLGACLSSTLLGVFSPLFFARLSIDPAVASGPIVTAFNDVISMALFFIISGLISSLYFS